MILDKLHLVEMRIISDQKGKRNKKLDDRDSQCRPLDHSLRARLFIERKDKKGGDHRKEDQEGQNRHGQKCHQDSSSSMLFMKKGQPPDDREQGPSLKCDLL